MAKNKKKKTEQPPPEENADNDVVQGELVEEDDANETEVDETEEVLVGFTMEEVDQMKQALEKAELEAKKNLDGWQRALADFSNLRRRTERDQIQMRKNAVGDIAKHFIDVVDDLDLALKNRPEGKEGAAWAEGIELIFRKLTTNLDSLGIVLMETEGQLFDPHFHEAISQEDSPDHESGQIIEVLKPGYTVGERVLRPALVRVAA